MDKVQLKVGEYVVQRVWNIKSRELFGKHLLLVSGSMPEDGHTQMSRDTIPILVEFSFLINIWVEMKQRDNLTENKFYRK